MIKSYGTTKNAKMAKVGLIHCLNCQQMASYDKPKRSALRVLPGSKTGTSGSLHWLQALP
ncbi:hypothetical protein Hgul01_00609 [Herpetosiphon gulosus]|uniref:Uncharacterized protein n=1 Tax=Herpetosiphon gulosus TaxID=1973496 RepID=A0ABP9WUI9_9CHLR